MPDEVVLPEGQEHFKLSEVCKLADVQPYMLRFWGTEFSQLQATKQGGGQRSYSRAQVETILEIRRLLFDEGLTIAGARKRINALGSEPGPDQSKTGGKGKGKKKKATTTAPEVDKTGADRVKPLVATLQSIRGELSQLIDELKAE
jgi:DNA-binding transcriptional MerR regulator